MSVEKQGKVNTETPYLSSVWFSTFTKMEEVEMVPMEEPSQKDGLAGTMSGRRYEPNTAEEEKRKLNFKRDGFLSQVGSVLIYMVPINTNSHLKMLHSDGKDPTKSQRKT